MKHTIHRHKTLLLAVFTFIFIQKKVALASNYLGQDITEVDPRLILGDIIAGVLGIIGAISLVVFIYGGVLILLSVGNYEKVKKGRDAMIYAAVGLIIIFSSYALVSYIFKQLT